MLAATVLLACGGDYERSTGPSLHVFKLMNDSASECWAPCDEVEAKTRELLGALACDTVTSCGFVGGADELLVVADYGDLQLDKDPGAPTLKVLVDGVEVALSGAGTTALTEPRTHFLLRGRLPVADGFVQLRVDGGSGFATSTGSESTPLTVVPAGVNVCMVCDAEGVDSNATCQSQCASVVASRRADAVIELRAPLGLLPPEVKVTSGLDAVPLAQEATVNLVVLDGALVGIAKLAVPDLALLASGQWTIRASAVGLSHGPVNVALGRPEVRVRVAQADCDCAGGCVLTPNEAYDIQVEVFPVTRLTSARVEQTFEGVTSNVVLDGQLADFGDRQLTTVTPSSPSKSGTWQLRGRVGPYVSDLCSVRVEGP